jgi:hypothetical protein
MRISFLSDRRRWSELQSVKNPSPAAREPYTRILLADFEPESRVRSGGSTGQRRTKNQYAFIVSKEKLMAGVWVSGVAG